MSVRRFLLCLAMITCGTANADPISPPVTQPARTLVHTSVGDIPVVVSLPEPMPTDARLIVFLHGFGQPASPDSLAQTIPLDDARFVGVYVALPMIGARMPAGGIEELKRVQSTDFVNGLYFRAIAQSASELAGVVDAIESRYGLDRKKGIGLFGFSAGGSAALLALTESHVPIAALVAVNAPVSVRQNVAAWEHDLQRTFVWDEKSEQAAKRFDVQAHAAEIAARHPRPNILFLQGDRDEHLSTQPATDASAALRRDFGADASRIELHVLAGTTHNFGPVARDDHGLTISDGAEIRRQTIAWFEAHLRDAKPAT